MTRLLLILALLSLAPASATAQIYVSTERTTHVAVHHKLTGSGDHHRRHRRSAHLQHRKAISLASIPRPCAAQQLVEAMYGYTIDWQLMLECREAKEMDRVFARAGRK